MLLKTAHCTTMYTAQMHTLQCTTMIVDYFCSLIKFQVTVVIQNSRLLCIRVQLNGLERLHLQQPASDLEAKFID